MIQLPHEKSARKILVKGLSVAYQTTGGKKTVINSVSFALPMGKVAAFIGKNGAGKSSILRAIVDPHLRATGTVELDGQPLDSTHIGYVPQQSVLTIYPWIRGFENVALAKHIAGASTDEIKAHAYNVMERMGMGAPLERPASASSGGERTKFALLRSLAGEELKLWVLDEPFEGLDRDSQKTLSNKIREMAAAGVAVLLTSHRYTDFDEVGADVFVLEGEPVHTIKSASIEDIHENPSPISIDEPRNRRPEQSPLTWHGLAGLAGGVLIWQLLSWLVHNHALFPSPIHTFNEVLNILGDVQRVLPLSMTIVRALLGWIVGLALGIAGGLVIGFYQKVYRLLAIWLSIGRCFPVFVMTGFAIGALPNHSELQRLLLIFLMTMLVSLQMVSLAAYLAPRRRLDVARLAGASDWYCLWHVIRYEIMGSILSTAEITLPLSIIVTLVVETFMIPEIGLGLQIMSAMSGSAGVKVVLATVLLPAVIGAIGVWLIRRSSIRWRYEM
jgi:ABC-type multidrug transport system ATPase subunit/ABC-type nitrate/sulfonate/bicarbonate transport system permease component